MVQLKSRKKCNSMFSDSCPKPYCQCWHHRSSPSWKPNSCSCGEDNDVSEWRWEKRETNIPSWVDLSENKKQVTFHPFYSSGTAVVRGDTPMQRNYHYYWEVKMLTETYGTDIMVGIGTNKMDMTTRYNFTSLLGQDAESYGLSYRGAVRHGVVLHSTPGFCRGSIVGVRVDMWAGTLEFYINREPQGVCFTDLRQHEALYPMACSTAAQSSMRLTYAGSWRASLLVSAARSLARAARDCLPPGLRYAEREQFWLTLPSNQNDGGRVEEEESRKAIDMDQDPDTSDLLAVFPHYVTGFYGDHVDRRFRLVVWQ